MFDLHALYCENIPKHRRLNGLDAVSILNLHFYPKNDNLVTVQVSVGDGQPLPCEEYEMVVSLFPSSSMSDET